MAVPICENGIKEYMNLDINSVYKRAEIFIRKMLTFQRCFVII